MLPVEPRMVRRRLIGVWGPISYEQGDVVYRGGRKEQAVYAVEDAPVAGRKVPRSFTSRMRFRDDSKRSPHWLRDGDDGPDYQGLRGA